MSNSPHLALRVFCASCSFHFQTRIRLSTVRGAPGERETERVGEKERESVGELGTERMGELEREREWER